jgi:hypothetical protein
MREICATLWGVLCLRRKALQLWGMRRNALAGGLFLLFLVSFFGGVVQTGTAVRVARTPARVWEQHGAAIASTADFLARMPLLPDAEREMLRGLNAWLDLQQDLRALPRPLGYEAGAIVQSVSEALAVPYRRLALWLTYTLAVFALVRALGGRAELRGLLAASALYALPHALDVLGPLPWVGPIAAGVATVWGGLIYWRAVHATSGLGRPQALLAVLLPGAAALTLALSVLALFLLRASM